MSFSDKYQAWRRRQADAAAVAKDAASQAKDAAAKRADELWTHIANEAEFFRVKGYQTFKNKQEILIGNSFYRIDVICTVDSFNIISRYTHDKDDDDGVFVVSLPSSVSVSSVDEAQEVIIDLIGQAEQG